MFDLDELDRLEAALTKRQTLGTMQDLVTRAERALDVAKENLRVAQRLKQSAPARHGVVRCE